MTSHQHLKFLHPNESDCLGSTSTSIHNKSTDSTNASTNHIKTSGCTRNTSNGISTTVALLGLRINQHVHHINVFTVMHHTKNRRKLTHHRPPGNSEAYTSCQPPRNWTRRLVPDVAPENFKVGTVCENLENWEIIWTESRCSRAFQVLDQLLCAIHHITTCLYSPGRLTWSVSLTRRLPGGRVWKFVFEYCVKEAETYMLTERSSLKGV